MFSFEKESELQIKKALSSFHFQAISYFTHKQEQTADTKSDSLLASLFAGRYWKGISPLFVHSETQ